MGSMNRYKTNSLQYVNELNYVVVGDKRVYRIGHSFYIVNYNIHEEPKNITKYKDYNIVNCTKHNLDEILKLIDEDLEYGFSEFYQTKKYKVAFNGCKKEYKYNVNLIPNREVLKLKDLKVGCSLKRCGYYINKVLRDVIVIDKDITSNLTEVLKEFPIYIQGIEVRTNINVEDNTKVIEYLKQNLPKALQC